MKKLFLYASLLCIGLVSCKKDYLVPEGELPSWLGESIYKELQQSSQLEGTFNTYCRLIDDLGYNCAPRSHCRCWYSQRKHSRLQEEWREGRMRSWNQ